MGQRYSDYIKFNTAFIPVYDITNEVSEEAWQTFIPTRQFCELLSKTLTAVSSGEPSKRRSLWLRGTFGTGKSHASAVVKHLLCDPMEGIAEYVEKIVDASLRERLLATRRKKRYFAVTLKGVEGAYDVPRFKLTLQREMVEALRKAGHGDMAVRSDFARALEYARGHEELVKEAMGADMELEAVAGDTEGLCRLLEEENTSAYMLLEKALRERHSVVLEQEKVSDWLEEMEREVERRGIADGVVVFWDEFSSVIDTIKSDRINVLQNIAEKSRHSNLFLFLISHRVEVDTTTDSQDLMKMKDRFYEVNYEMDEVSTYRIMGHTFSARDKFALSTLRYDVTKNMQGLFDYLCGENEEEKKNIQNLFPLHPYTVFLCSRMSRLLQSESASRSVLRFMNDEECGFKAFIEDEGACEERRLLTADRLWDFFMPAFEADSRCGAFIATYNSYRGKVEGMDTSHLRVFKVILLLNAVGAGFDREGKADKLQPTEENIRYMFADDRWVSPVIEGALRWLDENNIVNRNAMGEYKIASANYDPKELQRERQKIEAEYTTAAKFLAYDNESLEMMTKMLDAANTSNTRGRLNRPAEVLVCSAEDEEAMMRSMMKRHAMRKANHLHIAVVYAVLGERRDGVRRRLQGLAQSIEGLIVLMPEETLGEKQAKQFVGVLTNLKVAKIHFNENDAEENNRQARQHIKNWMRRLMNGTYSLYFEDKCISEGTVQQVGEVINRRVAYSLFSKGFESVKAYRDGTVSNTFFKTGVAKALVKQVMESRERKQLTTFGGSNRPAQNVFEYGGNNLIDEECEMSEATLRGDSWLAAVCREVDKCLETAQTRYADRFSLSEVLGSLMYPPYGFFQTPACFVALTYALRKHRTDLFIPSTSQVATEEKLEEMIVELFNMWKDGNSEASNKLLLRFGSEEESRMTELLKEIFPLKVVAGVNVNEVRSLNLAKWGVQEYCKTVAHYPLWTVQHSNACTTQLANDAGRLIELLEMEAPTVEKIKEVVQSVDKNRIDLHDLFSTKGNYEEGMRRFISEIDGVEISEAWEEEMMEEMRQRLQSEVAFWKQSDVENCVLRFYNKKTLPPVGPPELSPQPDDKMQNNQVSKPQQPISPDTVRIAKERINKAEKNSMQWQKWIMELLKEHEELAKYIIDHLD